MTARKVDPRDTFMASHPGRTEKPIPPGLVEDLRYYREQLDKYSKCISWEGLQSWISKSYDMHLGRTRLHRIATDNGIAPWWSK